MESYESLDVSVISVLEGEVGLTVLFLALP